MEKMSRMIPPDTGGRTLMRFNRRGMVVALDAQRHRQAVAHVDDAGALPGPTSTQGASVGKRDRYLRDDL